MTRDVPALVRHDELGWGLPGLFDFQFWSYEMKKTNADHLLQRAKRQVANTSAGGHLGGTNFGQAYDAKTSSVKAKSDKVRRNTNGR
ncbi:hypothetical protein [Rhizobium mongolense]